MALKFAKAVLLSALVAACSPEAERDKLPDVETGAVNFGADVSWSTQRDAAATEREARLD
ncbi:MAG: hypothetical protein WA978_17035 [Sphingopyxis granuli]|uniref:hypothetical protein n=1 Tax=Sphingopyxis granuli TaxID=267128 RepID=UPI0010F9B6D1